MITVLGRVLAVRWADAVALPPCLQPEGLLLPSGAVCLCWGQRVCPAPRGWCRHNLEQDLPLSCHPPPQGLCNINTVMIKPVHMELTPAYTVK